jgi:hypothetical protein
MVLIGGGMLWLILDLVSPGMLPRVSGSIMFSIIAIGAGIVALWLNELERQRRRWKGLKKQAKKYYD